MSLYYLYETKEEGLMIRPCSNWEILGHTHETNKPMGYILRGTMKECLEAWDKHYEPSEPSEPSAEEYNEALAEFESKGSARCRIQTYYLIEEEEELVIKEDSWYWSFPIEKRPRYIFKGSLKDLLTTKAEYNPPSDEEYNSALAEFEGYTSEMAMWERGYNDGTKGFQSLAIGCDAGKAELALYNIYQKGWEKGREDKATENLRNLMESLM